MQKIAHLKISSRLKAFFDCFEYQQTHTEYLR